ncbi:unnamed protein product [Cuscuta campestris]|uniref:Pentacotripeptide-repeat region of PRORP domain-containing protein n=1 Tax=Cuscuta campestris TaxID=132261 RepID=A0A484K904_9ASTE|nr:unnamed protein product [Cuscuta campestris]
MDHPNCYSVLADHLRNRRIDEARALFSRIRLPGVYLCTKMIAGYAENGRLKDALDLFDEMPVKDVVMWNSMIKGCVGCGDVEMAMELLDEMPERNVVSYTTVITGFLKFGMVEEAGALFREMPSRDITAWNAMVSGYFENDRVEEALRLFEMMPHRNVVSWTTVICGLDRHERSHEALMSFAKMLGFGVKPNSNTFASVLTACATTKDLVLGCGIHAASTKAGLRFDVYVTASLITFYATCLKIDDSCRVFQEKIHKNVVVWTSLVTAYTLNHMHKNALSLFARMLQNCIPPNQSSFTSALNSTCEEQSVDHGKEIHCLAFKLGFNADAYVGNSLVVLYSKCGDMSDGLLMFDEIKHKNIVSWNSIIVGCAQHGLGNHALGLFAQMVRRDVVTDDITLAGLLAACSHSGMFGKARAIFGYFSMSMEIIKMEHYACMVDILCRDGRLDEAENLVNGMPVEPNLSVWVVLLSGCAKHCDVEFAERAAKKVFQLDPNCSAAYVMLSNMYAAIGRWDDVERIRVEMKRKRNIVKQPGFSVKLMADARTDTGGSSAGKGIGDLWNKLFGWVMKMKSDEQSGISQQHLPIGTNRLPGERALREWMSNDSSGEESEPEVVRSEPLIKPGQVRELMLERLGLGSNGSGTDSDGAGHGVLEDFGIVTNIEGFQERLQEIVREESCAADSLEGVAEMFQEGDAEEESLDSNRSESESAGMEWASRVFSAAGHALIWVLGKVCWCADVLLQHYNAHGF